MAAHRGSRTCQRAFRSGPPPPWVRHSSCPGPAAVQSGEEGGAGRGKHPGVGGGGHLRLNGYPLPNGRVGQR